MDFLLRWRTPPPIEELSELETILRATLKPVVPRESYALELQRRLMEEIATASGLAKITPV